MRLFPDLVLELEGCRGLSWIIEMQVLHLFLIILVAPAFAHSDFIHRQWSVPPLTPIIEVDPDLGDAPFRPEGSMRTFEAFNDQEIRLWLQSLGVTFPSGSKVSYFKNKNGRHTLAVVNTPTNLALVDDILGQKYPVHTCLQLLDRFLSETEGRKIAALPTILAK